MFKQWKYDKPVYKYILWHNCNFNCSFCDVHKRKWSTKEQKIDAIQKCYDHILSREEYGFDIVLIGGEIMNDVSLLPYFDDLFDLICDFMLSNKLRYCYIVTNLGYKDLSLLDHIAIKLRSNHLLSRLHLSTSYDVKGRFNDNTEATWLKNVDYLNKYKDLRIVVNTVMTNAAVENIDKLLMLQDLLGHEFYPIPYYVYNEALRAPIQKYYESLQKFYPTKEKMQYYIGSYTLDQKKYMYEYDPQKSDFVQISYSLPCGHDCLHASINKSRLAYVTEEPSCVQCLLLDYVERNNLC